MTEHRITLGFPLIGDGKWSGGLNYQRNLLEMISAKLSDRISVRVIVTAAQQEFAQEALGQSLTTSLIVDDAIGGAGRGKRLIPALLWGEDAALSRVVAQHGIDIIFETARFFGWRFSVPALVWMPDFQHRHLPALFSRPAWWRRDLGFRAQSLGKRVILLSSRDAEQDCNRFYAATVGRTAVARFAGSLKVQDILARSGDVARQYGLPERYFFLPNQFWAHKNHAVVLRALAVLQAEGNLDSLPPVVMSGATTDHRHAGGFETLVADAARTGVTHQFRHLGLIPYEDVLALNAGAMAVINPSLFEGWASSVEEAKSLGTPLILSDIRVHREQAPEAMFFASKSAEGLARQLRAVASLAFPPLRDVATILMRNESRMTDFADGFWQAVQRCYLLSQSSGLSQRGVAT